MPGGQIDRMSTVVTLDRCLEQRSGSVAGGCQTVGQKTVLLPGHLFEMCFPLVFELSLCGGVRGWGGHSWCLSQEIVLLLLLLLYRFARFFGGENTRGLQDCSGNVADPRIDPFVVGVGVHVVVV